MVRYAYDPQWHDERRRLAGIERLWDPGSRALLERLGVDLSWRCLEVGAGGGSMIEWLAGRTAHVVAVDVATHFLAGLDLPNVEVREHDVLARELPAAAFDLVYARFVAEHLGVEAVERMIRAVRPGGLLVLEDFDWVSASTDPPDEAFASAVTAVMTLMAHGGFDPFFGRRLANLLTAAGLADVGAEGRTRVSRAGGDDVDFYRLSLMALREQAIELGLLTVEDADRALALLADPRQTVHSPVVVSGWGRAPATPL